MAATFQVSVVTPEKKVLDVTARFAALPAHDGEIGILAGRAPLLVKLGIGRMRVDGSDGREVLMVDGGFAQMVDNRLTVLTEGASRPNEIDRDSARQALSQARSMKVRDDASFEERQKALKRAQTQLRLAP